VKRQIRKKEEQRAEDVKLYFIEFSINQSYSIHVIIYVNV